MSIGSIAVKSGLGIGAATAVGTFLAHERLEADGQWTASNAKFGTLTTITTITAAAAALGVGAITRGAVSTAALGLGGGILFGAQAGHVAGQLGAMAID